MLSATVETKTAEKLICFLLGSGDHILEDVAVKERELFISDATDVYPASALRWLVTKKQLFYMPRLCLTRWIGWKLFCGQLYWWSRWLILTSFTQVSDKLPSNVAIKKICVMVVIFTCCQLFLTVLSTSIWLSLAMYYWLSVWATRQSTYEIFNEFRVFRPSSDFTMAQRYT